MFSTSARLFIDNFATNQDYTRFMAVEKHSTFPERLRILAAYYNMSMAQFARELSCPPATMHGYVNENREPKLEFFRVFAKRFPEIDLDWLIAGEGSMLNANKIMRDLENQLITVNEQLTLYRKMDTMREEVDTLKKGSSNKKRS